MRDPDSQHCEGGEEHNGGILVGGQENNGFVPTASMLGRYAARGTSVEGDPGVVDLDVNVAREGLVRCNARRRSRFDEKNAILDFSRCR